MLAHIFLCALLATAISGCCGSKCGNDFPCDDGSCIDKNLWCDSVPDCPDQSDEKYCVTSLFSSNPNNCNNSTYFICKRGECIPKVGLCDGHPSCPDGSDEKGCKSDNVQNKTPTQDKLASPGASSLASHSSVAVTSAFTNLQLSDYEKPLEQARKWLISCRRDDFGWGDETARALIAMQLSRDGSDAYKEDDMLMKKQLDIALSIALVRNDTRVIELADLALFINALKATCDNPKNFYGNDLVKTLRHRTIAAEHSNTFVSPLVYLTLCINNAIVYQDVLKLQQFSSNRNPQMEKIDMQALAVLAIACVARDASYSRLLPNIVDQLVFRINRDGLPGNVYETALVVQALNEVRKPDSDWHRAEAMNFILQHQKQNGSFGDILATYYVLPILSGRSLLSLDEHCDHAINPDVTPIAVLKNTKRERILVRYRLDYGKSLDMSQTLEMKVADGTNFLDIMRLAQESNPKYKFKLDMKKSLPTVYSIGGIPNDAEKGLYWTLYVKQNVPGGSRLVPQTGNIKELVPRHGEEIVFWLKQL